MMKLALGHYKDKVHLFSLKDGKEMMPQEISGIIISAQDCHIHVLPTKLKSDLQINSFIDHFIKTVHPGPYDQLQTDYAITGIGKNRKMILVIMENHILEAYQVIGKPLYFFFQTTVNSRSGFSFGIKTNDDYEFYTYEDKVFSGVEITSEFFDSCVLLPDSKVTIGLNRHLSKRFFTNDGHKKDTGSILLTGILTLLFFFLGFSIMTQYTLFKNLESSSIQKEKMIKKLDEEIEKKKNQTPENQEVRVLAEMLYSSIPNDYYSILSRIVNSSDNKITIKSLKITGDSISINGEVKSVLRLVENLKKTKDFSDITPSRIYPKDDGLEEFSLTGKLK